MMRKSILSLVLAVVLLVVFAVPSAAADADVDSLLDGLIDYELKNAGAEDVNVWISGKLAENAGNGSEWYIIALSRLGDYDLSPYAEALKREIAENGTSNAVERQRCAVALTLAGYKGEYIENTPAETMGRQGIMSVIFSLHLSNNGVGEDMAEAAAAKLLELQFADGGWALNGETADVDITAMALQALAPHKADAKIDEAIQKALQLLSERQLDNGGFMSYGKENSESAAQVLMALSALGIDFQSDERFIKNKNTALDAMLNFRLEDGSFEHEYGAGANKIAQYQAFCAAAAIKTGALYLADSAPDKEIVIQEAAKGDKVTEEPTEEAFPEYKLWICGGVVLLCAVWCTVLAVKKKKGIKNYLAAAIAGAVLIGITLFVDVKSADDFYAETKVEDPVGKVTVSITCHSIAGKDGNAPKDGIVLSAAEFDIGEGDTAYDLLIRAARSRGIHTEGSGSGELMYISGIANIYEFDHGDLSGWLYTVNGASPSVGCAAYQLSDGDSVEWIYTVDMGKNIPRK
ncbi:MAG: DUF4430 domain-containing protein [Oscillospiraceae bacterium]|nr:DUF4430 domain-containing protein [Oscillospiraceae bacterium]